MMAAFTSKANGDWSSTGATTWVQAGYPTAGDTVTINGGHTVTVDIDITIGNDSGTAILGPDSGTGTITIANGKTLTVRGNIGSQYGAFLNINVGNTAGGSLVFDPPNSSTQFSIQPTGGWGVYLFCNGTSGQHSIVKTDFTRAGGTGLASFIWGGDSHGGLITATYTDFIDLGTSSDSGVSTTIHLTILPAMSTVSITNCTFLRSSYKWFQDSSMATATYAFSNNKFTSSVGPATGFGATCAIFSTQNTPAGGTNITIDSNSFDLTVDFVYMASYIITNNFFGAAFGYTSLTGWAAAGNFANNFIHSATGDITIGGSLNDCYVYNTQADNPHYLTLDTSRTTFVCSGLIFETSTSGNGDCIVMGGASPSSSTLVVKNTIVVPIGGGSNDSSGNLISPVAAANITITVEHCTFAAHNAEGGVVGLVETNDSYAGEVPSCRANLVWNGTASQYSTVAIGKKGTHTVALDTVTISGYNGFYNPYAGTCTLNGTPTSTNGYDGLIQSTAASIGVGDFTADPQFVDNTRCLSTWGGTTAGGGVATNAGALATLAANPTLIGQATTGLLAWIRAGWRPQNVAYSGTSYLTDNSTTDAAGNSWAGTYPDVGAMAYYAPPSTATATSIMMDF